MKLLMTRLVGGLLGMSGSAGMINRRRCSIDLIPSRRHMVTAVTRRTETELSGQAPLPAPAAADDSHWMLLNYWGCRSDSTTSSVVPDDKTAAESRTTWGRPLCVSLDRVAPPAISSICFNRDNTYNWLHVHQLINDEDTGEFSYKYSDSDEEPLPASSYDDDILDVVAAHGDSVLLMMSTPYALRYEYVLARRKGLPAASTNYFLYRAAAAAGQKPSLSLLPDCHIAKHGYVVEDEPEDFFHVGLLSRVSGDDDREVIVAHLQVANKAPFDTAELCVLRTGRCDWELKEAVPIVHNEGGGRHDLGRWIGLNGAVPAGNRFLCWVNYDHSTLLVADMAEVLNLFNPKLRYVPLPMKAVPPKEDDHVKALLPWKHYRSIGAVTTGAAAPVVTFVDVDNRSCSGSAFVVTTWTMALNTTGEPMEWVKEGVLNCEELWAALQAAGYDDIPRVDVNCPVVSSENPDVVCFMAQDIDSETNGNTKSWTLAVDMKRKTLASVVSSCDRHAHPFQWGV